MALTIDSISKLSNAKKVLVLAAILLILGLFYFKAFIQPERELLSDNQIQYDKLVKELNESRAITQDLQIYKEQVKKMNEEFSAALKQLPNEKEIPEILRNISSLGKEAQLEFVLFKPKPEEPQQFYARVPIELTMIGTYHDTGRFFDRVSKLPRIINVVDFNMVRSKGKEGSEEVLVRTSCMMNTYRFVEKKVEEKKSEKKVEKKTVSAEEGEVAKVKK